jgi:hypothetical protein
MLFGKKLIGILSIIIILSLLSGTTLSKSVYAITKHMENKLSAYYIQGDQIYHQTTIDVTKVSDGAVGLALDPDSSILFVTYEDSDIIEMVNAKTMISEENPITVTGASSLAGIAFDHSKQKLYVVDRKTKKLFVFLWNSRTRTLTFEDGTYKTLANLEYPYAYGIALDESAQLLYVTDSTNRVKYYDTTTWDYKGSISIVVGSTPREAVGIVIDSNRRYIYTGSFTGGYGSHTYLVRTDISDINSPVSTEHNVGAYVIGVTSDQDTGFIYVTTKNEDIEVYNTATFPSDPCYTESNNIFQPAGIVVRGDVSYKPPLFYLEKVDVNEPNSVIPGDFITYRITYGPNSRIHDNVVLTDFLSYKVDFISASGPDYYYNADTHTVIWDIGHLDADDPCNSVTLTVIVNEGAEPNGVITNYCEIESDTACTSATADTNVGSWPLDSEIIYVNYLSPFSPGTGMSWRFAYRDLQDALERARRGYGSEIWVAEGIYKPTTNPAEDVNFQLVDGVALYGGFAGTEISRSQRNWLTNQTILDGDIDNDGVIDNGNVPYVVTASNVSEISIIDGFTIMEGLTAGILTDGASPTIRHNKIIHNNLYGINCTNQSTPNIKECQILENNHYGIVCTNSDPNISQCLIKNNTEYGIYGDDFSEPVIKNNWIFRNGNFTCGIFLGSISPSIVVRNNTIANNDGYGIYMNSYAPITNCIVWGNSNSSLRWPDNTVAYSCIQGNPIYLGIGNINTDPCFVSPDANNFHLSLNSRCIDAGDPDLITDSNETDIDGEPRILDGDANGTEIVDMGADEFYWSPADFDRDEIVNFLDYAVLASAWLTSLGQPYYNPICDISIPRNNTIDANDLARFCDYWLWLSPEKQSEMMMGAGYAQFTPPLAGVGFTESLSAAAPFELPQTELQSEPEPQPQLTEEDIQELVDWLEQLWLTDEQVRETSTEAEWLEFIEILKQTPLE